MKIKALFAMFLLCQLYAWNASAQDAQDDVLFSNRITIKSIYMMPTYSDTNTKLPVKFNKHDENLQLERIAPPTPFTSMVNIKAGVKFQVVFQTATDYIIKLWNYRSTAKEAPVQHANNNIDPQVNDMNSTYNIGEDSTQIYYIMPIAKLNNYSAPLLEKWAVTGGVFTVPFKYRPQDGTFEPAFNVSGGAGVKLNFNNRDIKGITFFGAIGASTIALTRFNSILPDGVTNLTTAGITPSISVIYQWKKLQLGIPCGFDFIFDNRTYKYKNQGKPWFAVSIGIGIFTDDKQASQAGNQ